MPSVAEFGKEDLPLFLRLKCRNLFRLMLGMHLRGNYMQWQVFEQNKWIWRKHKNNPETLRRNKIQSMALFYVLHFFFTLAFLCSCCESLLWIFLSLCEQITRIRGNMISIFLCMYLHEGAGAEALMKPTCGVLDNNNDYYFLYFSSPTPFLWYGCTLDGTSIIPLAGN